MNIIAIQGSPHRMKGTTGQLLAEVIRGMASSGTTVTTFLLADLKVQPCVGCETCHKTGECVIKDDFGRVKTALLAADGIVLASPNYMRSVTAQMKALLDRCSCPVHCQALEGRYGAAVVTSGGPGSSEVEEYMQQVLRAMGAWTVGGVGAEAHSFGDAAARKQAFAAACALGARLVEAIRNKRAFPDQAEERAAFAARMKQLVTMRKEDWPYEYGWWAKQGKL